MWGVSLIKNFSGVYNEYCTAFETEDGLKDFWFAEIDHSITLKLMVKKNLNQYVHQIYFMNKSCDVNNEFLVNIKEQIYTPSYEKKVIYVPFFWRITCSTTIHHLSAISKGNENPNCSELIIFSLLLQYSVIFSIGSYRWHVYILSQVHKEESFYG